MSLGIGLLYGPTERGGSDERGTPPEFKGVQKEPEEPKGPNEAGPAYRATSLVRNRNPAWAPHRALGRFLP